MEIGVCSWSLQVRSIPELERLMQQLGVDVVHIGCGDPQHGSWSEGDAMPAAAKAARFRMCSAMLAFPGEDYSTPQSIARTGGFGPEGPAPEAHGPPALGIGAHAAARADESHVSRRILAGTDGSRAEAVFEYARRGRRSLFAGRDHSGVRNRSRNG